MKKDKIRKNLNKYIKENLSKGYSIESIKTALIRYGIEKTYVKKLIKNYTLKNKILMPALLIILILTIFTNIPILKDPITGFITISEANSHTDSIKLTAYENKEYYWIMENKGSLQSLKIGGEITKTGTAQVYLEHDNELHLIFDSKQLKTTGLPSLTALVISNESNSNTLINKSTTNKTSQANITETPTTEENNKIAISLEYHENSDFDTDNNGIESLENIIDLTVEDSSFNLDETKLCTKWEVFSENDLTSTTVCYGNKECCNLINLEPSKDNWKDILYLSYGLYGATHNNTVTAQTIFANYSLDINNPYSNIYYSDISSKKATFYKDSIEFNDTCIDTCILPNFNKTYYKLIINITNATLTIENIDYSVKEIREKITNITKSNVSILNQTTKQYKAVIGRPVRWKKMIKLEDKAKNISIEIPKEARNIDVKKIENGKTTTVDNVSIKTKTLEEDLDVYNLITGEAVIKTETGLLTQFFKWFSGITGAAVAEIEEENATLIVDEVVEELEVTYYTDAPQAIETEISDFKKQILVTSKVHYEDILTYTVLTKEAPIEAIRLYWLINNTRVEVDVDKYDTNDNGLVDYVEWITPHLSNQTYELEITILNVQSYPTVGGNWTIQFNTTGAANLTIKASNGTSITEMYTDNDSTGDDLELLELKCNNTILFNKYNNYSDNNVYFVLENQTLIKFNDSFNKSLKVDSIKVLNYSCNLTAYHTEKVLTPGVHNQEFNFSGLIAYAKNFATNLTTPTNLNHSVNLEQDFTIRCNATTNGIFELRNVTLFTDFNRTKNWNPYGGNTTLVGISNSTDFLINPKDSSIFGNYSLDNTFKYTCKWHYQLGYGYNWSAANYTFSGWNLGTYTNTSFNHTRGLNLSYGNTTGTYLSTVKNATSSANWTNVSWHWQRQSGYGLINLSLRTCDDPACSGEGWQLNVTNTTPTKISFSNISLVAQQYFQYRANFFTTGAGKTPNMDNVTIDYIKVSNTAPVVDAYNISSTDNLNRTNGTLLLNWTYSDEDSDKATRNETKWYKDGAIQTNLGNNTNISSSLTSKGEVWNASIRVFDGSSWSSVVNV